jgi:hypothetical protein
LKYNAPYGVADPNAPYQNGNPATGTAGSIPPAAAIEYPQREIVNLITNAGITPDNADLNQLARAIQGGKLIYAVDSGTANNYVVALNPPLLSYFDGLSMWVLITNTNSGAAVINVNGLGSRNIVRRGGAALIAGDMPAQYKSLLTYNSVHNNFELYGTGFDPATGFLPILTANTNLYVNTSTGSDSLYDGTSPTISGSHGPFKTVGRAINETFKYGPSLFTMTINVATGTYQEALATPSVRGPTVVIIGAGKTSTFIGGANGSNTILCQGSNNLTVRNLCTYCGGTVGAVSPDHFLVASGASFTTDTCASSGACPRAVFESWSSSSITVGNHDFNSGSAANQLFQASTGGQLFFGQSANIQFLGPVTVSDAVAKAEANGVVSNSASPYQPSFVSPGNVTGAKFGATLNGVIYTSGQGVNWFPGTTAGYTNTGGQYL